ncbi:MAG: putative Ig domain-containing protein, partial [Planctomycetota bacterium]|nr:putative Ig domain-containing protein [Planctomycetota bacterium]
ATYIALAWIDNSTDEDGFKIERKEGAGGTYAEIDTVGAGVTSYLNTGLSPATEYYYKVMAYNTGGNSAYSNEVNAVTNIDSPPVLATIGPKSVNENANLNFTLSAPDPDGDVPAYTMVSTPTATGATLVSGTFNWTPGYTQAGAYSVEFIATAGGLTDSEVITITVNNVDRPPVWTTAPIDRAVDENQPLLFTIVAEDPDGTIVSYTMTTLPAGATITASNGAFSWTTTFTQQGSYPVTFRATSNGLSVSQAIIITVTNVDRAPVLAAVGNKSVNENANLNFTITAPDPDGDVPAYTMVSTPTATGATLVSGTFNWTPGYTQAGAYSVEFIATAGGLTDSEVITITVNNVDRPPVWTTAPIDRAVDENQPLLFTIVAEDPDGTIVSYTMTTLPAGATITASNGAFSWTTTFTQQGSYPVTFRATSNGLSVSQAIIITVTNVDRAPVLAAVGNKSVNENANLNFTITAPDPDGDTVAYTMVSTPAVIGAILNSSTGAFSWTPSYTQAGSYTVTFTATALTLSDSETIITTVNDIWSPSIIIENTASIGSLGGTLEVINSNSPIYGTKIELPTSCITSDTTVTISRKVDNIPTFTPPANTIVTVSNEIINFSADGQNFTQPVRISIPYPDTNNDGIVDGTSVNVTGLSAMYYDADSSQWKGIPSGTVSIDLIAKTINVVTTHL